jgi:hypothetical protein
MPRKLLIRATSVSPFDFVPQGSDGNTSDADMVELVDAPDLKSVGW